ncbi:MAG: alpha/beta hydrolase [Candidatus Baltobacteraceae bacterium]
MTSSRVLLISFLTVTLAAGSRLPALADCQPAQSLPGVFFVTDRQPLSDEQLFSGERGFTQARSALVSRGVVSSPVSKRTERRCSTDAAFLNALGKNFDSKRGRQILVYIHGYYTTFKTAAATALTIQQSLRFPGPIIVYSWPSKVTSRLAYINDETNAGWSMVHFRNFLATLRSKYPNAVISFAAHSLGARFAAEGIAYMRHTGCANCLGWVVLFAPDVDSDTLRSELAAAKLCTGPPRAKPKDSAQVVLYVSNKDLALRQSQQVHGHQRAGQAGTEMLLCNGVDTIDVSYLKSADKAGHSYQVDPPVLMDARQAFAGVSPMSAARKLKSVARTGKVYYELKP